MYLFSSFIIFPSIQVSHSPEPLKAVVQEVRMVKRLTIGYFLKLLFSRYHMLSLEDY